MRLKTTMNQMSTIKRSTGIPLLLKYIFVCLVIVTIVSGSLIGIIELDRRQETEIEVKNLYEIVEIQISAQFNNIVGDALDIEAITKEFLRQDPEINEQTVLNLERIYSSIIENSGKYAAISYVMLDGSMISSGKPKSTEISQFMKDNSEGQSTDSVVPYAYFSRFRYSNRTELITFILTIPIHSKNGPLIGYVMLEPYLHIMINDVKQALANASISMELISIEEQEAYFVYSEVDSSRGRDYESVGTIFDDDILDKIINSESGDYSSADGESFFESFVISVSNATGERHIYNTPGNYKYVLTLPTDYYLEITKMATTTRNWLIGAVAVVAIFATVLMYIATSNRRKYTAKTTKMAQLDSLTGLLNRAYFTELFENLIEDEPESKYAILFMDLDGFKDINDSYGHDMGDKVLRIVANRLVMAARREDLVARFGGDEFAMLISYNSVDQIKYVSNKVVKSIDEVMIIEENEYNIGVSLGVAIYPDHARTVDDLYKVSDNAMYKVKYSTKNAYYISKGDDKVV